MIAITGKRDNSLMDSKDSSDVNDSGDSSSDSSYDSDDDDDDDEELETNNETLDGGDGQDVVVERDQSQGQRVPVGVSTYLLSHFVCANLVFSNASLSCV